MGHQIVIEEPCKSNEVFGHDLIDAEPIADNESRTFMKTKNLDKVKVSTFVNGTILIFVK